MAATETRVHVLSSRFISLTPVHGSQRRCSLLSAHVLQTISQQ